MTSNILIKNVFGTFNSVSAVKVQFDPVVSAGGNLCKWKVHRLVKHDDTDLTIGGAPISISGGSFIYDRYKFANPGNGLLRHVLGHFLHALSGADISQKQALMLIRLMVNIIEGCHDDIEAGRDTDLFYDHEAAAKLAAVTAENERMRATLAAADRTYDAEALERDGKISSVVFRTCKDVKTVSFAKIPVCTFARATWECVVADNPIPARGVGGFTAIEMLGDDLMIISTENAYMVVPRAAIINSLRAIVNRILAE